MKAACWTLCLALTSASGTVSAQLREEPTASPGNTAPSPDELTIWSKALESDDETVRTRALTELIALEADGLPAIEARLRTLSTLGLGGGNALHDKLTRIRAMQAGTTGGPSARVSVLREALASERDGTMCRAVEILALLHALEAQRSPEAAEVMVGSLFALAPRALRPEALATRKRLTKLMVPAYLRHRRASHPVIRRLSRDGLAALGVTSVERSLEHAEARLLAATLAAHAAVRDREALPWLVAYLTDDRPEVREAAYAGAAAFGPLAVPLLQQQFSRLIGTEPEPGWGSERLLTELRSHREQYLARYALAALERAETSLHVGKLDEAEHELDVASLHGLPEEAAPRAAALYSALASVHDAANRAGRALRLYRRALRSDPQGSFASAAEARASYIEAEYRLRTGIADLRPLTRALALDPSLGAARLLLEELQGARADEQPQRRRLGLLAAALLALAALIMLRTRPQSRPPASSRMTRASPTSTTRRRRSGASAG